MRIIILLCLCISVVSCNTGKKNDSDGFSEDTSGRRPAVGPPSAKTSNAIDSNLINETNAAAEAVERRQLLCMSIDSTYYVIGQLESIKNTMGLQDASGYSLAERNARSRALFKLNLIENDLTRKVDSVLLKNLKIHTRQLEDINEQMLVNAAHLQELSEKLAHATRIMDRLTEILGSCISKGLFKPLTPVNSTATAVKATVI